MPTYRWTGDGPFRDGRSGRDVDPGETVELDAHAGDPQPELVRVEDDKGASAETASAPFDPSEETVADLRERLQEGDFSAEEVDALEAAERAGEARETALDAIETAR